MGFEPTVALGDTRSPGAPDRPLQHLSTERVGFEPTLRKTETAFRERHHQPLGHLSLLILSSAKLTVKEVSDPKSAIERSARFAWTLTIIYPMGEAS